jgi:hypothetical protein
MFGFITACPLEINVLGEGRPARLPSIEIFHSGSGHSAAIVSVAFPTNP